MTSTSTAVSGCAISMSCDILAATACFAIFVPGGLLTLPNGIRSDDKIWDGAEPNGPDRFFGTGRIYYQHYLFHLVAFILFFTLYRVLKGILWEKCNY